MQVTEPSFLSEEEFLARPPGSGVREELFDGVLVVTPSPSVAHQSAAKQLFLALHAWAEAQVPPWDACFAPLDVRFGPRRILQPDVLLFERALPLDTPGPVDVLPTLVAEVLSPSWEAYDRLAKRAVYADAGVRECWLVDPARRAVEVFGGDGLRDGREERHVVASGVLRGLVVDVEALFRR